MATAANSIPFMVPLIGRQSFPDDGADADSVAALAAELQRGERSALDRVYHRFAAPLLQLATRLTGSPETGEDVVHDVFVGLPCAL